MITITKPAPNRIDMEFEGEGIDEDEMRATLERWIEVSEGFWIFLKGFFWMVIFICCFIVWVIVHSGKPAGVPKELLLPVLDLKLGDSLGSAKVGNTGDYGWSDRSSLQTHCTSDESLSLEVKENVASLGIVHWRHVDAFNHASCRSVGSLHRSK